MLKLGWFSTGRGEGSRGFLELVQDQIQQGALDASIEFVFSNREHGEAEGSDTFFKLVDAYGIPLVTLSSQRWRKEHGGGPMSRHRDAFHNEAMRLISPYHPDFIILAGYMLVTNAEMCRRYTMINLHPALPGGPAGTWQQVIWELIRQRADRSGVMTHIATEELDAGPVLAYCGFPIRGGEFDVLWREADNRPIQELMAEGEEQPLFKEIRRQGVLRERPLLLETLRALSQGRLQVRDGRVLDAGGAEIKGGVCLNDEVEAFLNRSASA